MGRTKEQLRQVLFTRINEHHAKTGTLLPAESLYHCLGGGTMNEFWDVYGIDRARKGKVFRLCEETGILSVCNSEGHPRLATPAFARAFPDRVREGAVPPRAELTAAQRSEIAQAIARATAAMALEGVPVGAVPPTSSHSSSSTSDPSKAPAVIQNSYTHGTGAPVTGRHDVRRIPVPSSVKKPDHFYSVAQRVHDAIAKHNETRGFVPGNLVRPVLGDPLQDEAIRVLSLDEPPKTKRLMALYGICHTPHPQHGLPMFSVAGYKFRGKSANPPPYEAGGSGANDGAGDDDAEDERADKKGKGKSKDMTPEQMRATILKDLYVVNIQLKGPWHPSKSDIKPKWSQAFLNTAASMLGTGDASVESIMRAVDAFRAVNPSTGELVGWEVPARFRPYQLKKSRPYITSYQEDKGGSDHSAVSREVEKPVPKSPTGKLPTPEQFAKEISATRNAVVREGIDGTSPDVIWLLTVIASCVREGEGPVWKANPPTAVLAAEALFAAGLVLSSKFFTTIASERVILGDALVKLCLQHSTAQCAVRAARCVEKLTAPVMESAIAKCAQETFVGGCAYLLELADAMDVALDVGPFLPILGMYGSRNLVDKVKTIVEAVLDRGFKMPLYGWNQALKTAARAGDRRYAQWCLDQMPAINAFTDRQIEWFDPPLEPRDDVRYLD